MQLRAIVKPGQIYRVVTSGIEGNDDIMSTIGRCDHIKVVITLAPAESPKKECA